MTNKKLSDFPEIAAQFHKTKNGDSLPDEITAGSGKKFWWQCDKGHEWEATCGNRAGLNSGCPYCKNQKVCKDNSLATLFPEIAAQFHTTKNGDTTPEQVIAGSQAKFWWQCLKGHEWKTTCSHRTGIAKSGCPYCSNRLVCKENCLSTLFPEIAVEFQKTRNGNLTPDAIMAGSGTKFWWQCLKGHEWKSACNKRTTLNRGCPYCENRYVCKDNCLATLFPKIAAEFHKTKNGNITPETVIAGSHTKFWWQCEKGHEWKAQCKSRTGKAKGGCPICCTFKGEIKVSEYLKKHKKNFKSQHRIKNNSSLMIFDFVVRRNGKLVVIEYQGVQHYRPVYFGGMTKERALEAFKKGLQRDQNKRDWCTSKGYELLEIPYWELDRIDEILDEFYSGKWPVMSPPPAELAA